MAQERDVIVASRTPAERDRLDLGIQYLVRFRMKFNTYIIDAFQCVWAESSASRPSAQSNCTYMT